MKNLRPLLLGVIIGALITYFFCPRQGVDDIKHMAKEVKCPKDTISVAEATKLFKNWQKYNPTEIDSIIDVVGSRKQITNVGWSLDFINEYLTYAEAKSDSLGYTMTGIRLYMGNYGKCKDPKKINRNTLFIVPTGHKKTSKASSLNLSLFDDNNNLPVPPGNEGAGGQGGYPN